MGLDTGKLLQQGLDLLTNWLKKKGPETVATAVSKEVAKPVAQVEVSIDPDWANPKSRLSANFSVGEALTLPSWGVMHVPSDEEKAAIKGIAEKVTKAIEVIGKAIGHDAHVSVHAWMRPGVAHIPGSQWDGKDYNRYIYETQVWKDLTQVEKDAKHVPDSPHKTGHAIDFHIVGYEGGENCAKIREILLPHLEELGLRMEKPVGTGGWVHLDDLPVIHERFFNP